MQANLALHLQAANRVRWDSDQKTPSIYPVVLDVGPDGNEQVPDRLNEARKVRLSSVSCL